MREDCGGGNEADARDRPPELNKETYIYNSTYTYRCSRMGWDLEKSTRITEPEVERWGDVAAAPENDDRGPNTDLDIFRLSGGVIRSSAQTSNRIDGLLSRMLESPSSCKYVKDIDKNLDYLFTHLQLDMIERVGKDATSREEGMMQEEPRPEPVISLERARLSV